MPALGYTNPSPKAKPRSESKSSSSGGTKPGILIKLKALMELKRLTKNTTMIAKLKSRKLWATIIGSLIVTAGPEFGLSPDVTQWIATIVTGYVIGQGIADAGQGLIAAR